MSCLQRSFVSSLEVEPMSSFSPFAGICFSQKTNTFKTKYLIWKLWKWQMFKCHNDLNKLRLLRVYFIWNRNLVKFLELGQDQNETLLIDLAAGWFVLVLTEFR